MAVFTFIEGWCNPSVPNEPEPRPDAWSAAPRPAAVGTLRMANDPQSCAARLSRDHPALVAATLGIARQDPAD